MLTVGQTITTSDGSKWECYNVTATMSHLAKLKKNGQKAQANAQNLLNLTDEQISYYVNAGIITSI